MVASSAVSVAALLVTKIVSANWVSEFLAAHGTVKNKYAFTKWKSIDWDARAAKAQAEIEAAQNSNDTEALFWAVRDYAWIGDGHVALTDPEGWFKKSVAGGFGLEVAHDDLGRLLVVDVADGSAAARAGVSFGDQVVQWAGQAPALALAAIPMGRLYLAAPTTEGQRLEREMLLTRGTVGAKVQMSVLRVASGNTTSVELTAMDDGWRPLVRRMGYVWPFGGPISPDMPGTWLGGGGEFDGPNHGVEWHIMTGPNVGYLKIMTEDTGDAPLLVSHATEAVKMFKAMHVRGVVLDMRSNNGGDDPESASIVELFYTGDKSVPYPYADIKVATVKPNNAAFAGPVAVLIDHNCVSACEGICYALRKYLGDRTRYFSFDTSTMGAFGLIDDIDVEMPGGLKLKQLMQKDGKSMEGREFFIEANGMGIGGVPADVVIPATLQNLRKRFHDGADLPLEEAVKWIGSAPASSPTQALAPALIPSTCPGDSLRACLGFCPASPAMLYKICVEECGARCIGTVV